MERARFGREAELARVSSFLDAVPNGPHALVLGGEAGIGKSAVWLDALEDARARSYRVLSSRPTEAEAKLSFAAVGDLLDDVVDEVLDAIPAPQRTALEIALLRTEAGPTPPDRRTLSSAFHGALIALAEAGPVVLAIDDAVWLDPPSARVVEFAIRRLHDVPIGILDHGAGRGHGPSSPRPRPSAAARTHRPADRRSDLTGGDPRPSERRALHAPASIGPPRHPRNGGGEPLPGLGAGARDPSNGDRPGAGGVPPGPVHTHRPRRRPAGRTLRSGQAGAPPDGGRLAAHRIADRTGDRGDRRRPSDRSRLRRRCDRGERGADPTDPPAPRDRAVLGVVRTGAQRRAPEAARRS